MTTPYYRDDYITLYHGDAQEFTEWLTADVLVTDPPYGRRWRSGSGLTNADGHGQPRRCHGGIAGDRDTGTRDAALAAWGPGLASCSAICWWPSPATQSSASSTPKRPTREYAAPEVDFAATSKPFTSPVLGPPLSAGAQVC